MRSERGPEEERRKGTVETFLMNAPRGDNKGGEPTEDSRQTVTVFFRTDVARIITTKEIDLLD